MLEAALEKLLRDLGSIVVLFVILGSLVDVCQAAWIIKRTYRKTKRIVYNRIKEEVLRKMEGGEDG